MQSVTQHAILAHSNYVQSRCFQVITLFNLKLRKLVYWTDELTNHNQKSYMINILQLDFQISKHHLISRREN